MIGAFGDAEAHRVCDCYRALIEYKRCENLQNNAQSSQYVRGLWNCEF